MGKIHTHSDTDLSLFPLFCGYVSGCMFRAEARRGLFGLDTLEGGSSVKETYGLNYSKGGFYWVQVYDCGLGDSFM